jgi:pSer/pThr/pTyr-binding forkhead associated (FHA) protein
MRTSLKDHDDGAPCCGACESGTQLSSGKVLVGDRGPVVSPGRQLVVSWSDSGGEHERVFDTTERVTIGRGKDCGVVINSGLVSRVQCTIEFAPGGVSLRDAGSGCGTFINGEKISQSLLRQQDKVFIGNSVLRIITR